MTQFELFRGFVSRRLLALGASIAQLIANITSFSLFFKCVWLFFLSSTRHQAKRIADLERALLPPEAEDDSAEAQLRRLLDKTAGKGKPKEQDVEAPPAALRPASPKGQSKGLQLMFRLAGQVTRELHHGYPLGRLPHAATRCFQAVPQHETPLQRHHRELGARERAVKANQTALKQRAKDDLAAEKARLVAAAADAQAAKLAAEEAARKAEADRAERAAEREARREAREAREAGGGSGGHHHHHHHAKDGAAGGGTGKEGGKEEKEKKGGRDQIEKKEQKKDGEVGEAAKRESSEAEAAPAAALPSVALAIVDTSGVTGVGEVRVVVESEAGDGLSSGEGAAPTEEEKEKEKDEESEAKPKRQHHKHHWSDG